MFIKYVYLIHLYLYFYSWLLWFVYTICVSFQLFRRRAHIRKKWQNKLLLSVHFKRQAKNPCCTCALPSCILPRVRQVCQPDIICVTYPTWTDSDRDVTGESKVKGQNVRRCHRSEETQRTGAGEKRCKLKASEEFYYTEQLRKEPPQMDFMHK